MNLLFDFGNTRIKGAVFNKDELVHTFFTTSEEFDNLKLKVEFPAINKIGITAVTKIPDKFLKRIKAWNKPVLMLDSKTPLPLKLNYNTPETLGADRICNAVAGKVLFPNRNVLIIDLGTCNKYDFVDCNGVYLGGSIAAGFEMRLAALHKFTANLPLIKTAQPDEFKGKTTKSSIETGTFWGIIGEINEFIRQYQSQFNDTKVWVTGGYLSFFEKVLKNFIFADPNLTLRGLNSILNFQED